ncbi:carbamoyltransferase HypF [Francisella halioticida]|uniref:carbamoyltransferase HypF n=1 Tax=Francisella halioticida TaxID=549298 RepID=UPI001AF10101|nr:carbamoyltransferase HypF [Francisella halioticida]BCD92341.1 carbamoyltransferase HypF [Francisella halioticida]
MQQTITKILVNGIVQGVGFRPFIYCLAKDMDLCGSVKNTPNGVKIILQCDESIADSFIADIKAKLPPLANIETIEKTICQTETKFTDFKILETLQGNSTTKIPADTAICNSCLDDIFNPRSRYYLYPYTSCTHCGPRFSTIQSLPYDRDKTTYKDFPLCNDCLASYTNPLDRHYHAQTIACSKCGPKLSHSFAEISQAIKAGKIIAIKSQNGFKLVVNATNTQAVTKLRNRKHRPNKPFALMALNTQSIQKHSAEVTTQQAELLNSTIKPIVLLKRHVTSNISKAIASNINQLGFMLPTTGTDYILFYHLLNQPQGSSWLSEAYDLVLIATSANISGESIIADNNEAHEKLKDIADLIVTDNRDIAIKSDDSVFHTIIGKNLPIRRSQGLVPQSIQLSDSLPDILATGAFLKNTFCFIKDNQAFVSQHIGNMDSQANIEFFELSLEHFQKMFGLKFDGIACDLHPDIYTTHFAQKFNLPIYQIQHHQAHLTAVIAEHNLQDQAIGLVLDGFGLGEDGLARGGELYHCDIDNLEFNRIGELDPIEYIGGDKVAKEPWRIALALCHKYNLEISNHLKEFPQAENIIKLLQNNSLPKSKTTSMGRLFDAVSSLLNICHINSYESQSAMELESLANQITIENNLFKISCENTLILEKLFKAIIKSSDKSIASNLWHGSLAYALVEWVSKSAQEKNIKTIILSGGCFQNKLLLTEVYTQLKELGFNVYISEKVPLNDGSISLGQAWLGAKKFKKGEIKCV